MEVYAEVGDVLTALDVFEYVELKYLSCFGNELATLNITGSTSLVSLSCNNNKLTTLDVSKKYLNKTSVY